MAHNISSDETKAVTIKYSSCASLNVIKFYIIY